MACTICVAKTNALISCAAMAELICTFVFTYAKSRFSLMKWLKLFKSCYLTTIVKISNLQANVERVFNYFLMYFYKQWHVGDKVKEVDEASTFSIELAQDLEKKINNFVHLKKHSNFIPTKCFLIFKHKSTKSCQFSTNHMLWLVTR